MDRDVRQGLRRRGDQGPELRRAYLDLPWPHLYEFGESTRLYHARAEFLGDIGVLAVRFRRPETFPEGAGDSIRRTTDAPIELSTSRPHRCRDFGIHPPPGLDRVPEHSAVAAAFAGDLRRLSGPMQTELDSRTHPC
jgi:hypothetical protein